LKFLGLYALEFVFGVFLAQLVSVGLSVGLSVCLLEPFVSSEILKLRLFKASKSVLCVGICIEIVGVSCFCVGTELMVFWGL